MPVCTGSTGALICESIVAVWLWTGWVVPAVQLCIAQCGTAWAAHAVTLKQALEVSTWAILENYAQMGRRQEDVLEADNERMLQPAVN